jgi:hypothetical protein
MPRFFSGAKAQSAGAQWVAPIEMNARQSENRLRLCHALPKSNGGSPRL